MNDTSECTCDGHQAASGGGALHKNNGRASGSGPNLPAVLIVDDVPDNILALEGMLRREDIAIVTATSGRDALEILIERDVAVAIIDVSMPEMDGFELAELIHGVERTRHIPIIFVTAGSTAEDRVFTGYRTGAIDFLIKPLNDRVLRAKVDVLITLAKHQRDLYRALEFAEAAMKSLGEGLYTVDDQGRVTSMNPAAEEMFGWTFAELRGLNMHEMTHHHYPDGRPFPRLECAGFQVLTHGQPLKNYEDVFIRKDGTFFDVIYSSAPMRDAAGKIDGLVVVFSDVTERKQAEKELRESEARLRDLTASLETKVSQRTAELELQAIRLRKLATELSRVEQSERKRLAALLHDDLQQSLVAAKISLTYALDLIPDGCAAAETGRAEKMIGEAIETARNLTRELRPPALYEGGLIPALEALASETQRLYRIRVSLSASEALPRFGEEFNALVFGCVRELLFNAAKHSGASEVSVAVSVCEGALHVVVSDRGNGFDADEATLQMSSGFGLFSIQERLAVVEGAIDIRSRVGEGCRVELIVPVSEIALAREHADAAGPSNVAQAAVDEKPYDAGTERRYRVVIADDHPIVREGIANVLDREERIRVIAQVGDGAEAVEAVERLRPDVVLLDVNMPRMDGIEAARKIHNRWPEVVIIGLSVQDDEATAGSMLRAGASVFIPKSDDPSKIANAILCQTVT